MTSTLLQIQDLYHRLHHRCRRPQPSLHLQAHQLGHGNPHPLRHRFFSPSTARCSSFTSNRRLDSHHSFSKIAPFNDLGFIVYGPMGSSTEMP
ncbi:hypothetical protein U1Q18_015845 [Sarracenia purpurea var. burkii]